MPQYIQLPNGAYFEVKKGERPEDALVAAASMYPEVFKQEAPPPEQPKEQGSYFGDLGRSFASGAVGATGALTSIFGADNAASRYLAETGESLQKGLSTARQAELRAQAERMKKAEESGSTWEEIKAGLLNVLEAPIQTTASALGSFVPMVATLPLQKIGLGARAVMAVRGAIGGAQGAGAVKQNVYEAVLQAEMQDGKSPEEAQAAAARAQSYVGENLDQILLGGGLGVAAGTTGAERLLPGGVRAQAGAAQQALAKRIGERGATGLTAAAGEMPLEGLQGGQERLAANLALQRTGRDVDAFTGVAGQATQEALAGGLGGATLGVALPDRSMSIAARKAEEERLAQEAKADAEYKASDEYALDIASKYEQATQQLQSLQEQKRKIVKNSPTADADREHNTNISNQIRALRQEVGYDDLKAQYQSVVPRLNSIEAARFTEAERNAPTANQLYVQSPQETIPGLDVVEEREAEAEIAIPERLMEQRQYLGRLLEDNQERMSAAAASADVNAIKTLQQQRSLIKADVAALDERLKATGFVDTAGQTQQLQQEIAKAQQQLQKMAGPGFDPDKAAKLIERIERAQAQLAEVGGDQQVLDLGAPRKLSDPAVEGQRFNTERTKRILGERQDLLQQQQTLPDDAPDLFAQQQLETAEDTFLQRFAYDQTLGFVPSMLEKATAGVEPDVAAPEGVTFSERTQNIFERIEAVDRALANTKDAKTQQKLLEERAQLSAFASEDKNASTVYDLRDQAEDALFDVEKLVDMLRNREQRLQGTLYAEDAAPAKQVQEAKERYIRAVLQEAAAMRRIRGEKGVTLDEALKAADKINTELDELITRGQAVREVEEVVTQPAQMRGTKIVSPAKTEMRDTRPLEQRPFGKYRAALGTILEGVNKTRQELVAAKPAAAQRNASVLKMQFADVEADRVAEARGEKATTLTGELRRRAEFVRNKMGRLKGMRPAARDALNKVADAIDENRVTRDLLDAAEVVIDSALRGQMPLERDIRAINDALAAMTETPAEQRQLEMPLDNLRFVPGEEKGEGLWQVDRESRAKRTTSTEDLGYIRATAKNFEKAPAVVQARAAVDKAREEAKKIQGVLNRKGAAARALQSIRSRIADLENKINATLERTKPAARSADSFFSLSKSFVNRMTTTELAQATPERRAEYAAALQVEAQYQAMRQEFDEKFKREGAASRAAVTPLKDTMGVLQTQEKALAQRISDLEQSLKDPALVAASKARADAKDVLASKEADLLAQVEEQRADLQAAMDNAMAEVTAALDGVTLTTNPSVLAAKKALDASEAALDKTREQVGKAGGLDAAMQFANTYAAQVKEINAARDALAEAMAKAQAKYDKTSLIAKAYQDGLVKVELAALNRLEKRLSNVRKELGEASPEARAAQQEIAAQQKALDVAEARQREAREQAAKQQRDYDERMLKGFGLPFARRVQGKVEGYQTPEKDDTAKIKERIDRLAEDTSRIQSGVKAKKAPRAIGPATRSQSAAPAAMRTGSSESREGQSRTQSDMRVTEARGEKQTDVAMTAKEMSEANSIAAALRKKTDAQKAAEAREAEELAEELQKELDKYSKDDGELYFSRGTPTKGLTAYELRNELRRAIGNEDTYVRKVAVYESVEDFVTEKKRYAGRIPTDAKGFVDPETGRAYLFADNIAAGEGMGILLHEVGVHIGFRNFFNKAQFTSIANTVRSWADAPASTLEGKIGRAAKKRAEDAGTPESQMDDELIAYAVEEAVKAGVEPAGTKGGSAVADWLRTVVDAFNKAVKALGLAPEKLKVGDLVNMAYGAAQLEIKGTWHGTGTLFKEFDHKFMGSGEGFQAFSWGTYRAQRKGIAESYRDKEAAKKYDEWFEKPEIQRWLDGEAPKLGGHSAADFERFAATGKAGQALAGVPHEYAGAMSRALYRLTDAGVLDSMVLGPAPSLRNIIKYHASTLLGGTTVTRQQIKALADWASNADFSSLRMPFEDPLYKGMDSTDLFGVEGLSTEERTAVREVLAKLELDEEVKKHKGEKAVRVAIQEAKRIAEIIAETNTGLRRKKALKALEVFDTLKPEDFSYQQPTAPPIAKPKGVLMRTIHGRREEEYLHWDLPIGQNPEPARNSVINAVNSLPEDVYRAFLARIEDRGLTDPYEITGEVAYEVLKATLGSGKDASELLHKFGVAGTKFLDYGSRGKPVTDKSTYNYVDYGDKAEGATIVAADLEPIGPAGDLLFSRKQKDEKQGLLERTAALMSGVIPDNDAKYNANVPESVRKSFGGGDQRSKTFNEKLSTWALGLRVKALDAWGAREALVQMGLSGKKLTETEAMQTRIYMRLNSEVNRFVHQALLNGPLKLAKDEKGYFGVDVDDKKPSVMKVLETLRGAVPDIGNMKAVEEQFYKYMQIKRIEGDKRGFEVLNMRKPPTAQEIREQKAFIEKHPKVKQAFAQAEKEFREYNAGMLDFAHAAGVFTDKELAYFKNGNYVPFYRQTDDGNIVMFVGDSRRTIGNVIQQPQLKDLVGGEKDFLGFTESVMQNAQLLTRMSMQNLQARDVGFMVENLGLGKIVKGEGPANSIRFKRHGEPLWVKLETDLFPKDIPAELLLQGLHGIKASVPTVLKIAGIPTQILRTSIVRMPLYMIRQMIRDPLHAWMVTGLNFTPIVSSIKEMTKIRRGLSPTEMKLMRSGAVSSNVMTGDFNDASRTLRDLANQGGMSWSSAMQSLDNFALQGDTATRAVLYDKYREQGMSHFEAALGAAEVMNFSRRGTSTSLYMISTLIPFFNAQLQGLDSVWRTGVTGNTVFQDKLQVRQKLYQRAALMMGATLAYAVAMQDDEAYKNATPEERAMNWFIPVPGLGAAIRIPIPFEVGAVSKAIPELVFNAAFNDAESKDTLKGLRHVLGMSIPGDIPTIAKPIIESMANYSFFTKAPIESQRELGTIPAERYRPNTTELAKLMGQVGVSPLQVEHLVRGYTGSLGILAMSTVNPILRPFNSDTAGEKAERKLTEMPFFGAAFQPDNGRGIVASVYADVEDWQKAAGTFKRLVTDGRQAEARAFADKYAREIALSSTGGSFQQAMGELAAMRRAINSDPDLSAAEKRERLDEIDVYQRKLAEQVKAVARMTK